MTSAATRGRNPDETNLAEASEGVVVAPSRRPLEQILRFGMAGVVNTAIDFCIFSVLRVGGVPLVPANVVAAAGAMTFSFLVNRRFVFSASEVSWKRQALLFLLGTGFSMFVLQNLVVVGLQGFVPALEGPASVISQFFGFVPETATMLVRSIAAKGGATVVSLVWNFSFYRWVVFRIPGGASGRGDRAQ